MLFGYRLAVALIAPLYGDKEDIQEWCEAERADEIEAPTKPIEQQQDDGLATVGERYARDELTDE